MPNKERSSDEEQRKEIDCTACMGMLKEEAK
jgi:hypothetical protein